MAPDELHRHREHPYRAIEGSASWAVVDDKLVIGTSQAPVRAAIESASDDSLAGTERFGEAGEQATTALLMTDNAGVDDILGETAAQDRPELRALAEFVPKTGTGTVRLRVDPTAAALDLGGFGTPVPSPAIDRQLAGKRLAGGVEWGPRP